MEGIIIYPKNENQKLLLTSLLKELKIRFETIKDTKNTRFSENEFYTKINKSIKQAEEGKTKRLLKDEQKSFLGL